MKRVFDKKINIMINEHPYTVEVLPKNCKELNEGGFIGVELSLERRIVISDELDDITTMLVLRHELIHALLYTQGRDNTKKFNEEEVCEIIAHNLDTIVNLTKQIAKELGIKDGIIERW